MLVDPELAESARAQLADPGPTLPSPGRGSRPEPPRRSRGKWIAIVVAIAAAAALGGVGAAWYHGEDSSGSEEANPGTTRPTPAREVAPAQPSRRQAAGGAGPRRSLRPPQRPPAFHVPGAPREPLDEIPLRARAWRLRAWLTPSRRPSRANLHHWLYQHGWIVTGARFGWWQGAAALRILISVDRRVESRWGFGYRSEAVARSALAEVESKTH